MPGRDRIGDVPDLGVVVELVLVAQLRAGLGAYLGALFAGRAEADERAGDGAELRELVVIGDLELLDRAVFLCGGRRAGR